MRSARTAHTVLAVLSIALGVAAFTTVAAVDTWQRQQISALAGEFAPDVLVVRFADPWPEDVPFEPGQAFGLTFTEAASFGDLPGVRDVAARGLGGRALGGTTQIQRIPVTASIFEVLGLSFQAGGAFDDRAELLGLPVTVIGATVAEELYGGADAALGQTIDLGGQATARIDGVLAPIPEGVDEFRFLDAAVLVPNVPGMVMSIPGQRPAGTTVFVKHEPGEAEAVTRELRSALDALEVGRVHEIVSSEDWLGSQRLFRNAVADELRRGSTWVVLLALIATLGNLANTLGLRAADRVRSVAVRRALGATRPRIAVEVVSDGLLIGGVGTLLGLALWPVVDRLLRFGDGGLPVTPTAFVLAGTAGIVVTLLASVVPTVWTLRLPIAKALREQLAPPVWEGVALTGMAAGVLALVVASAIGTGADTWFQRRLAEIGADRVVLTTIGGPSDRFTSVFAPPPFDEHDVETIAGLPGVLAVATSVLDPFMALVVGSGEKQTTEPLVVARVSDSFFDINPKPIAHGRSPQGATEVVLGPQAAAWAFPDLPHDQVVGRTVDLARVSFGGPTDVESFVVAGVFGGGNWESPGDLYEGIVVRYATADDPPMGAASRDLHVRVDLAGEYDAVVAAIRESVSRAHPGYGPAVVHEPAGDLRQVRATMAGVGRAWSTMAWISLIVGGAGLASIVTVRLVRDRPRLALKRALGATKLRVAAVSTWMALRLAGYAGAVGLILAGIATAWVASIAPWGFRWPWWESVTALLIALLVALAAATLPVLTVANSTPWAALKEE